ncbi:Ig-7 domain-containing protein [Chitinophaga sp. 180180018-2]|nr:Ig-7 domain-containing protein [Chitinophaga sp. 212800010-3]
MRSPWCALKILTHFLVPEMKSGTCRNTVGGMLRSIGGGGLLLVLFILPVITIAQTGCPVSKVRKYASRQRSTNGVDNPGNAVDGDPKTSSTLNLGLLLGATTQYLGFDNTIPAGTQVSIKVRYPKSAVGVGVVVTMQPFVYKNGIEQAVGASTVTGDLLAALGGAGDVEVMMVPKDNAGTPVAYDGVWVNIAGVLAVGVSMNIYDAWITQNAPPGANCNQAIDVLEGARAGTLQLLNATGGVDNPWNAIDNDPNLQTYALMNSGAQVLSQVYETVVFNTPSAPNDSVYIVLQNPNGGLLNLGLLNGFTVQPYLGNTPVGSPITSNSSLLALRLLAGADPKYVLSAAIPGSFDRIDIQKGGVADLLSALRIYDVKTVRPVPTYDLKINGQLTPGPVCITDADKLSFNISNTDPCANYNWYAADNGTLLTTGQVFKPSITVAGSYTFYVEAVRNGCNGNIKNRVPVTVTAEPKPGKPSLTIQLNP